MLTLDLLRVKRKESQIKPKYLTEAWPAEYVLSAYRPGVKLGEARAKIDDAPAEPKLVRGLAHIAERLVKLEEVDKKRLLKIRLEVFREAARRHPVLTDDARRAVIKAVAERLKISEGEVEEALAKAHEDELVIVEPPNTSAEELVSMYNTALIQTLLFRSQYMTSYVKASGAQMKALIRALKGLGLMYTAEPEGGGIKLNIDGPASILKQTERYGTRLAKLVPYIIGAGDWRIEAKIRLYEKTYLFAESKSTAPRLSTRDIVEAEFDSSIEQEFYRQVSRVCKIEREPEALVVGGRVYIPDFKIGDLYVEVVGFWTPDYLRRKFEKLAAAKVPLLVLVDEKLALASWRELPHYVALFSGRPRLSDVYKYIKPYCSK
nr:MAG: nuclease [Thermoproteus sp. AZ2]